MITIFRQHLKNILDRKKIISTLKQKDVDDIVFAKQNK